MRGAFRGLGFVHALNAQPIDDIFQHLAMRQQGKVLEHHRHLEPAQITQLVWSHRHHVIAINPDFARSGFDQAVQVADQRGFARPGQAHDDLKLVCGNIQRNVIQAQHMPGLVQQFVLAHAAMYLFQRRLRIVAENLVQVADGNLGVVSHARPPDRIAGVCHRFG